MHMAKVYCSVALLSAEQTNDYVVECYLIYLIHFRNDFVFKKSSFIYLKTVPDIVGYFFIDFFKW